MNEKDYNDIEFQGLGIVQLAKQALEKPSDFGWWGKDEMFVSWGWCGIDKNNSSNALDIVNFDVISSKLIEEFPDDFEIVGLRHWAVGHVDRLTCRILIDENKEVTDENITDAFKEAMSWLMALDNYPIADEQALDEYCWNEMRDWIIQEIPSDVYIKTSKEDTANLILDELSRDETGDFDIVGWSLDGKAPTEEMIRYIAYDLSLCATEHRDLWDEWTEEQGLPPIYWGDNFGAPPNAVHRINGQLNLFDEETK